MQIFRPIKFRGTDIFTISLGSILIVIVLVIAIVVKTSNSGNPDSLFQPLPTPTPTPGISQQAATVIAGETMKNGWQKTTFSEKDLQGVNYQKTRLQDGATQYSIPSVNNNRPDEVVTKNNTIVFQRSIISGKTVQDYTSVLGEPEYKFNDSSYYGSGEPVYLYLKKGIAFIAGAKTQLVFEQINFTPMSLTEFKNKYGAGLTTDLK